jgi:pyruvate carboxylase
MTQITLMDTTLRDGNQSNWGATGLDTGMMLEIAPIMDRIGFESIDFTTSTHMALGGDGRGQRGLPRAVGRRRRGWVETGPALVRRFKG